MKLPRAILFDLDDTILVAFGPAQSQWQRTIAAFADQLGPIEATIIAAAIEAASTELWAKAERPLSFTTAVALCRRKGDVGCSVSFLDDRSPTGIAAPSRPKRPNPHRRFSRQE